MPLQITVRGSARAEYPAERATVRLWVVARGPQRPPLREEVARTQETILDQLEDLRGRGVVTQVVADQVQSFTERDETAAGGSDVAVVRVLISAEFVEFERMSGFVDHWASSGKVEVERIDWDVLSRNRRVYETAITKEAVEDAVATAQAYADAVRRGRVTATHLSAPGLLDQPLGGGVDGAMLLRSSVPGAGLTLAPPLVVISASVDGRFEAS